MSEKQLSVALKEYNERYYTHRLSQDVIQGFGDQLKQYIAELQEAYEAGESEEHTKKIINSFLEKCFYKDNAFKINTFNSIDSTIRYNGALLALMEVKKVKSKTEMISHDNINKKALWELVFYYLNETRNTDGNKVTRKSDMEIRRLIITDGLKWALIDAKDIETLCDGYLEKHYYKYRHNQLTYSGDTAKFYEDIKIYLEKQNVTQKLPYVFFDLEVMQKAKRNWGYIYKGFSREFLLKFGFQQRTTTHALNDRFYQELLYIIGLKEVVEKNRVVIQIDKANKNTFADQVFRKYTIDKELSDEDATERTFELIIIWLNRLLFIKLFEGQLIAFNNDDPCYHVLDNDKIKDFQNLQDLFFEVLGRKDRPDEKFYNQFEKVPYLNSSLFERQKIETRDININELKNLQVQKKSDSVLGKKAPKQIAVLEYVIDFLNSYSFAARSVTGISDDQGRDIIDAAVLGLIFEKLNGYRDGSHYTPSIITEYMCKNAIEEVVLRKINLTMAWECHTLFEVKERAAASIVDAKQINDAINSIRICDPAVGSGHFLVSALNRLIAIKKYLGVLFKYGTNDRLVEYDIQVIDDVLCILDGQGQSFVYDKKNVLSQQIQETLFNEKRTLIEDCLFGVDLNPKAVSICNLRLWIELLKNAYYKYGVMETLPNIDINIKCGNSLISRLNFSIGQKVHVGKDKSEKDFRQLIQEYKKAVKEYKAVADKADKKEVSASILRIKDNLFNTYSQYSLFEPAKNKKIGLYDNAFEWAIEFPEVINENGVFLGFDCVIGNPPYIQLQSMGDEADKLKEMHYATYSRMGDIYCLFYELGYKLLNDNGVLSYITSNKWMRAGYGETLRGFLAEHTNPVSLIDFAGNRVFDSVTVDVNILALEKGKNMGKTKACTIKDDCLDNLSVYVEQNSNLSAFSGNGSWIIMPEIEQRIKRKIEAIGTPLKEWDVHIYRGILTGLNEAFIIDSATKDALISADPKSAEIIRPILRGRDIKRYKYEFADLYIIATFPSRNYDIEKYPAVKDYLLTFGIHRLEQTGSIRIINGKEIKARKKTNNKWYETQDSITYWDDFSKHKIVWGEISDKPKFSIDISGEFTAEATTFLMVGESLYYLLGFLNSKLSEYYFSKIGTTTGVGTVRWKKFKIEQFPVPRVAAEKENEFNNAVIKLLDSSISKQERNRWEAKLDGMIYSLLGLTNDEITLIEHSLLPSST